jgi:hypothetical protein
MHGTEHALSSAGCIADPLPSGGFRHLKIIAFGTPRTVYSMEPVPRNGLSLACNGCFLSEASIPGSMVLACHFATCQLVPHPVRLQLLCRLPVCPGRWQNLSYKPVVVHFARRARLLPLSPLPSGTFASLGIKAFNKFRRFAAHLPNPPDSRSLPAAGAISSVWLRGRRLSRSRRRRVRDRRALQRRRSCPLSVAPPRGTRWSASDRPRSPRSARPSGRPLPGR